MNALQSRRGKGFWKFNNTLLADETYCSGLIERIHSFLKENVELSPCTKWEFRKMNVSQHTIQFSKSKRERELKMEKELEESMLELESKSLEVPKVNDELNVIKKGLRFKGALFRSKSTWTEQAERPLKYFMALEKRNYNSKHIMQIYKGSSLITNPKDILTEQASFFQE